MKLGWKQWAALALAVLLLLLGFNILRAKRQGQVLPVLMYHHFAQESTGDTVVTVQTFRRQMTALKEAGFTAVSLGQVLAYVREGEPLPDKPVLITMDDGYTSNLTLAAPILEELGFRATVFVIGINEGETLYAHSGEPLSPPRFSYEEAAPWVEKGVLDLQSHTYDLHQLSSYGYSGRDGVLPLEGESSEAYEAVLREDAERFRQRREGRVDTELVALAYPFGYWTEEADRLLEEEGILFTFTIQERSNRLLPGDLSCLRRMGRYNVTEGWDGPELVKRLEDAL